MTIKRTCRGPAASAIDSKAAAFFLPLSNSASFPSVPARSDAAGEMDRVSHATGPMAYRRPEGPSPTLRAALEAIGPTLALLQRDGYDLDANPRDCFVLTLCLREAVSRLPATRRAGPTVQPRCGTAP